jgi:hypothetical protein
VGKFWSGGSLVVKLLDFGRSIIEYVFSLVLVESYRAFWCPAVVIWAAMSAMRVRAGDGRRLRALDSINKVVW